jgi:hypothetical protein
VSADDDQIEIVHECLAERWPRLVRWRSEDAADRALLADVRAAARRWHDQQRPDDLLWRGAALVDLRRLVERSTSLTGREREFSTASLAAARRRQRLRRAAVVGAMAVLASVAGVMAYLASVASRNADHAATSERSARSAAELAEARFTQQLRASGQREVTEGRPLNALAYLGEVLRRGGDDDGLRLMIGQLAWSWAHEERTLPGVTYGAAAPDGSWFALSTRDRKRLWIVDPHGTEVSQLWSGLFLQDAVTDAKGTGVLAFLDEEVVLFDVAPPHAKVRITLDDDSGGTAADPDTDAFTGCLGAELATVVRASGRITTYDRKGVQHGELRTELGTFVAPICNPEGTAAFLSAPTLTRLVDLRTMRVLWETRTESVFSAAFADDGTGYTLTTAGVLRRHAPDGRVAATWNVGSGMRRLFVAPDGGRIAVSVERELLVFDPDGRQLGRFGGFRGGIGTVWFDGPEMWTGGADSMVRRWRADGVQLAAMVAPGEVRGVYRTRDGVFAFAGDSVRIWTGAPAQLENAARPECEIEDMRIATARPAMVVMCNDGRVESYDFDSRETRTIPARTGPTPMMLTLHPLGRRLATLPLGQGMSFWRDGILEREVKDLPGVDSMELGWVGDRVVTVRFVEPFGARDAGVLDDGAMPPMKNLLVEIDPDTGAVTTLPHVVPFPVVAVHGIDAETVLLAGPEGEIEIVRRGELLAQKRTGMSQAMGPIMLIHLSGDGRRLAIGRRSGQVQVLSLPDLAEVRRIEVGQAIDQLSIDHTGRILVTVSAERVGVLWDLATGEPIPALGFGTAPLFEAVFVRPDELLIYAGDRMGRMRLPRATGTSEELAAEIGCRVPLRPEGGSLVPTKPACPTP